MVTITASGASIGIIQMPLFLSLLIEGLKRSIGGGTLKVTRLKKREIYKISNFEMSELFRYNIIYVFLNCISLSMILF